MMQCMNSGRALTDRVLGRVFAVVMAVCFATAARPLLAEEDSAYSLDEGCRMLAAKVVEIIEKEGLAKTVAVGTFAAAPRLESSGGVGLSVRVKKALQSLGMTVQPKGAVQLSGGFADAMVAPESISGIEQLGERPSRVALRIEYLVRDASDRDIAKGVVNAFGDAPLEIAGGTGDLATPDRTTDGEISDESFDRQQAAIHDSFQTPNAVVVGSETRPSRNSPFGMEVRVLNPGGQGSSARRPEVRDGRSFVQLSKGDEYVVRLRNATDGTVLVSLTIDGLDAFTFSQDPGDKDRKVHFVLKPNAQYEVPGWFISKKFSETFRITDYARSEAVKMFGSSESVGQITATFYAAAVMRSYTVSAPYVEGIGTERGRKVETNYQQVDMQEGSPLATVTVRYEKSL